MTDTVTFSEGPDGFTVLLNGLPCMATTQDREKAVAMMRVAMKPYVSRHVVRVTTWNGWTGTEFEGFDANPQETE